MLAAAMLLTTSWLMGPPAAGQQEFYISGVYQEAPRAQHAPGLTWQRAQLRAGFAHTVDQHHTVRFSVPYVLSRSDLRGEIFYENRGIGKAHFAGERWFSKQLMMGALISIPMGPSMAAAQESFPLSGESIPPLTDGATHMSAYLAYVKTQNAWLLASQFEWDANLENGTQTPKVKSLAVYELLPDALRTGFILQGAFGLESDSAKRINVGILEMIGPTKGLGGELEVKTTIYAQQTESDTQASLTLVWRQ